MSSKPATSFFLKNNYNTHVFVMKVVVTVIQMADAITRGNKYKLVKVLVIFVYTVLLFLVQVMIVFPNFNNCSYYHQ